MIHWTQELKNENARLQAELDNLHDGLRFIKSYLQSSKFYDQPQVETSDVLLRIDEVATSNSSN